MKRPLSILFTALASACSPAPAPPVAPAPTQVQIPDTTALKGKKAAGLQFVGVASVIDGDTIEIHSARQRLQAIDAPESRQLCADAHGQKFRCGQVAANKLAELIDRRTVTCTVATTDKYQRYVSFCTVGETDINGWMVDQGYAYAYREYSMKYAAREDFARANKTGFWAGTFERPADWRKAQKQKNGHQPASPRR